MAHLNKIAEQIRMAHENGQPCRMPLMSCRDQAQLLELLTDDQGKKA